MFGFSVLSYTIEYFLLLVNFFFFFLLSENVVKVKFFVFVCDHLSNASSQCHHLCVESDKSGLESRLVVAVAVTLIYKDCI